MQMLVHADAPVVVGVSDQRMESGGPSCSGAIQCAHKIAARACISSPLVSELPWIACSTSTIRDRIDGGCLLEVDGRGAVATVVLTMSCSRVAV